MKRIIDNKRVEMTAHEYEMYKNICSSYDRPNFEGKELFRDHFETNEHGIIIFVKPPHDRYTSMEVFGFLLYLMQSQHIRIMQDQINMLVKEASENISSLIKEKEELQKKLSEKEKKG